MNCSQARALLAISRELNSEDRQALEHHLAQCEACNEASAQYQSIGERIRSMPQIELSPDAHDKLMHALAAEHVRYLQRTPSSATSTPTPAFLAPYLKELARKAPHIHALAALSTADTGPLPVVRPASTTARSTRRGPQMHHFTIVGIAASFLVVIMTSGLLSLLYLANQGQHLPPNGSARIIDSQASGQAIMAQLNVASTLPHVASASTSNGTVYYSAYNSDQTLWELDKFNQQDAARNSAQSTATLTSSTHPIVVLGSTSNWLLWLQMDEQKKVSKNTKKASQIQTTTASTSTVAASTLNKLDNAWSLKALYIGTNTTTSAQSTPTVTPTSQPGKSSTSTKVAKNSLSRTNTGDNTTLPALTLHTDTFMSSAEPAWVTSPIQGISFYQDHALVAYLDANGNSHLEQYGFDNQSQKVTESVEIARGDSGHVLSSPTATQNGRSIYWSDEWYTDEHGLSSNIWTRQETSAQPVSPGRFAPHLQAQIYQYRADASSFHPQIVGNILFLISKDPETIIQPQATATASATSQSTLSTQATTTATAQATATPASVQATATAQQNASQYLGSFTSVDPTVTTPQIDANVSGKLQAFTATGTAPAATTIDDNLRVTDIYSGATYLIWKDTSGKYVMYDVPNKVRVSGINDIDKDAAFVAVNGDSVVWSRYIAPTDQSQSNANNTSNTQVTFTILRWPR